MLLKFLPDQKHDHLLQDIQTLNQYFFLQKGSFKLSYNEGMVVSHVSHVTCQVRHCHQELINKSTVHYAITVNSIVVL